MWTNPIYHGHRLGKVNDTEAVLHSVDCGKWNEGDLLGHDPHVNIAPARLCVIKSIKANFTVDGTVHTYNWWGK